MRSLNKVMLIGNLGADPEVRKTQSGGAVATLRLATNEQWGDREGNKQERTEWHRVIAFGRLAEIVRDYLKKGRQLYVEGRIQTRQWQDQQGQTRYTTEIVALSIMMLGGRGAAEGDAGGSSSRSSGAGDDIPPDYGDDVGPVGVGEDSDVPF